MLIEFNQVTVGKIDRMGGVNAGYLDVALLIEQALAVRNSEVAAEHLMDFVDALSRGLSLQTCDVAMEKIVETCSFWSACFHRLANQNDELAAHIANSAVFFMRRDQSYFGPFKHIVGEAVLRACREVDAEDHTRLMRALFNLEHVLYRSSVTYTEGRSSDIFKQAAIRWAELLENISPQERYRRISNWNGQAKRDPSLCQEFERLTDRLLKKSIRDEVGKAVIPNSVSRMIVSSLFLTCRGPVNDSPQKKTNDREKESPRSHLSLVPRIVPFDPECK